MNLRTYLLFFQTPKDFIWTLLFSKRKRVKIATFDPRSIATARKLIDELKDKNPGLTIHLIGSAGLEIEGRGDLDLLAGVPDSGYPYAFSVLKDILGKPIKKSRYFSEWSFEFEGYQVELTLSSLNGKFFKEQILLFNLLKNNRVYLNEYRNLKLNLNECSELEYDLGRKELFNRILHERRLVSNSR